MSELIAPGSSMPMLRSPMSAARPLRARTPGVERILETLAQALALRLRGQKCVPYGDKRVEHRLIAALRTTAPLDRIDAAGKEFFKAPHVKPRIGIHRLARPHERDAVQGTRRAADVLDERASDQPEHVAERGVGRQLRETILGFAKTARHVQPVITVPGFRIHRREVVLLRHNRGDDRIHRITNICHLRHTIFLMN